MRLSDVVSSFFKVYNKIVRLISSRGHRKLLDGAHHQGGKLAPVIISPDEPPPAIVTTNTITNATSVVTSETCSQTPIIRRPSVTALVFCRLSFVGCSCHSVSLSHTQHCDIYPLLSLSLSICVCALFFLFFFFVFVVLTLTFRFVDSLRFYHVSFCFSGDLRRICLFYFCFCSANVFFCLFYYLFIWETKSMIFFFYDYPWLFDWQTACFCTVLIVWYVLLLNLSQCIIDLILCMRKDI